IDYRAASSRHCARRPIGGRAFSFPLRSFPRKRGPSHSRARVCGPGSPLARGRTERAAEAHTITRSQPLEHPMTKANTSNVKHPPDRRSDPSAIRGALGKEFLTRLAADFSRHGARIFPKLRKHRQQDYIKLVAAILPQEYRLKEVSFQDVSDQELAAMLS